MVICFILSIIYQENKYIRTVKCTCSWNVEQNRCLLKELKLGQEKRIKDENSHSNSMESHERIKLTITRLQVDKSN